VERAIDDIKARAYLRDSSDIPVARRLVWELAVRQGLSEASVGALATAVTEVFRNVIVHAWSGEVLIGTTTRSARRGIVVVARDEGPGIADTAEALQDGFSTSGGLGLGLPSARRLVDDFEIESLPGKGTTITMRKWVTDVARARME
jgi:serine/threonine-protein kinase RsbT